MLPERMGDVTPELVQAILRLGVSGGFFRFREDPPHTASFEQARRVRELLGGHGLRIYQATGYWQPLIHPDQATRREAVLVIRQALRLAGVLDAFSVVTGPGSLNPDGPWWPHPYNWTTQARNCLIDSLREASDAAEESGVYLCLEGHQLVTLESAVVTAEILHIVDSPWVKVNVDPVNWTTRETIYSAGTGIQQMFRELEGYVISGHAKDVVIENQLTLHLSERPLGQGLLDLPFFLRALEAVGPETPLIVEHETSHSELVETLDFVRRTCHEIGVEIIT